LTKRINISDGVKWEEEFAYSRAVRIGDVIEVSGTAAIGPDGNLIGAGNAYEQTRFILEKISNALNEAGSSLGDVVRTRLYVTDVSMADDVGRAHGECFRNIRPACTLIEVSALISPELLVEIEATAIVSGPD
jgi:enamine deaminase RidA (YjgF/YER057c/UK114 family)